MSEEQAAEKVEEKSSEKAVDKSTEKAVDKSTPKKKFEVKKWNAVALWAWGWSATICQC